MSNPPTVKQLGAPTSLLPTFANSNKVLRWPAVKSVNGTSISGEAHCIATYKDTISKRLYQLNQILQKYARFGLTTKDYRNSLK